MARIFCFGDSNTYGYDARSMLGGRLEKGQRWPDILQEDYGWETINCGMNGREIPQEPWFLERFDRQLTEAGPVDLVLIMLGTNDLLNLFCPDIEKIGARMEQFVQYVLHHPMIEEKGERLLLVAPPATDIGRFGEEEACYDREAEKFGSCYEKIAKRNGLRFADAGKWGILSACDGVHFTPEGHRIFAGCLGRLLTKI